jgi:hypothetical protein
MTGKSTDARRHATQEKLVNCENCGNPLPDGSKFDQRYCDKECVRLGRQKRRYGEGFQTMQDRLNISSGSLGALSELVACADLMRRGYEVFRAVSPTASCDLIATHGPVSLRIEVRTGYRMTDGRLDYPKFSKDIGRCDVYAVVLDGSEVQYDPDLPGDL